MEERYENDIAIIGMSGRFSQANNIDEYWQNLVNGLNSVTKSDEESISASSIPKDIFSIFEF